jgi:dihydroorotate dehydrogenase electron transfer subunit
VAKKIFQTVRVIDNCCINPGVFRLTLQAPEIVKEATAGQFVMLGLGVSSASDPLLKRPYSIAGTEQAAGNVVIIYRVVGKGTELMALKQPGDSLEIIGPLGQGFDLGGKKPLLVGGGMGLAPLLFAARQTCPRPVEVVAGGRTSAEMFWQELFQACCNAVHVTTDDGTLGACGTCVDILPEILEAGNFDSILTCGPLPMIRSVAAYAIKHNIPCQISMEQHMACGFGACLTCTCGKRGGGYVQVCKHGPVFKAEEVELG